MTRSSFAGIPVTIYTKKETKLIEFYEANKNKQVSQVSHEYNMTPNECRKWLDKGKELKDIQ